MDAADQNGAGDVRSMLGQLPDDGYNTPAAVNKAMGALDE